MKQKLKTGRPVIPNAGLRVAYERKLLALVDDMHRSTLEWLKTQCPQSWSGGQAAAAHDSSPGQAMPLHALQAALRAQSRQWCHNMDAKAEAYASWFAARANAAASAGAKASLTEVAGFTVKFRLTPHVNSILEGIVAENVSLINSIAPRYFDEVQTLVMRSVREGRDIAGLTNALEKRLSMTRDRAVLIARDQNQKASAAIARARMQDIGVTQGIWRHSSRARVPRPHHKEANGKVFDLETGLLINGRYVLPGQEINCGCSFRPVLPSIVQRQPNKSEGSAR